MQRTIKVKTHTQHKQRTKGRAQLLRNRVDLLRRRISKTIGIGWNSVQAQREIRQEK